MTHKVRVILLWVGLVLATFGLQACGSNTNNNSLFVAGDRGIGGTGKPVSLEDRGIGGTGIIGTITEFGSIWVNGIEIQLTNATEIVINNKSVGPEQLRLGQQVAVKSHQDAGIWYADQIFVHYVVTGTVESVTADSLKVNGLTLKKEDNLPGEWLNAQVGDYLKISGYFEKGVVFVTDMQMSQSHDDIWQVTGPVVADMTGQLSLSGYLIIPAEAISTQNIQAGDMVTVRGVDTTLSYQKDDLPFQADRYLIEQRSNSGVDNIQLVEPEMMNSHFDELGKEIPPGQEMFPDGESDHPISQFSDESKKISASAAQTSDNEQSALSAESSSLSGKSGRNSGRENSNNGSDRGQDHHH